ncbi:MAG: hypothetical protein R2780_01945 [Crocinitomicaceae bacterium]|nr:hypothetical protein [Crocinitomicaceae bacterium]
MRSLILVSVFLHLTQLFGQGLETSMLYVNEQGQVKITKVNDTLWHTEFENLDGYTYDTTLMIGSPLNQVRVKPANELFFLEYNWGGLSVSESKVEVFEFSSFGRLAYESGMSQIYTLPFVRTNQKITLEGDIKSSKGHATLDGIFFEPNIVADRKFYRVTGEVTREPFPRSFYSTSDSPQGMFSDTTKVYYRLVFRNYKIEEPERTIYKGTAINDSRGLPCIAWEMADSEAYILDGKKAWDKSEIGKTISVKGYLTQGILGSILKNWEIVDGH